MKKSGCVQAQISHKRCTYHSSPSEEKPKTWERCGSKSPCRSSDAVPCSACPCRFVDNFSHQKEREGGGETCFQKTHICSCSFLAQVRHPWGPLVAFTLQTSFSFPGPHVSLEILCYLRCFFTPNSLLLEILCYCYLFVS